MQKVSEQTNRKGAKASSLHHGVFYPHETSSWHSILAQVYRVNHPTVPILQPLFGDASCRRYFRCLWPNGHSVVLSLYPEDDLSTLNIHRAVHSALSDLNWPVPPLLAWSAQDNMMVFFDAGDWHLGDYAATHSDDEIFPLYAHLVNLWERLQSLPKHLPTSHPILKRRLDKQRFLYELEFFRHHFLETWAGITLTKRDVSRLALSFESLAEQLDRLPISVCHRDFHSRNILIKDSSPWIVDYQDMQLGPIPYDIVSLLLDCYRCLPHSWVMELRELAGHQKGWDDAAWYITALQRHLKALGTFGYQLVCHGRVRYRPAVFRTLDYVLQNDELDAITGFHFLKTLLSDISSS